MSSIVLNAPRFKEPDAVKMAWDLYGIDGSARLLSSERDQNFHLVVATGDQYVLKLANSEEHFSVLDCQNQAMMHIWREKTARGKNYLGCPKAISALNGKQIATVPGIDGKTHFVRLLSYLPGKLFVQVSPKDDILLESLGRFFGELDAMLSGFDHPAAHRDFHWDLKNAAGIITCYQGLIQDPNDRALIDRFLKQFQIKTEPQLLKLRTSTVHGDGNDYNVLVEPVGRWQNRVNGVIDFGDMVHTYTVNEVAIACAYAMLDRVDPLSAAAHVVSGYHSAFSLTEKEVQVLFDLICMRLCMSVCHCAHQYQADPENEYLMISNQSTWRLLHRLSGIHPRFAEYVFRHACGFSPVPHTQKIVKWLKQNADGFAPVVDADLKSEKQLVFDLSVGSTLISGDATGAGISRLSEIMFDRIRAAGVRVGIGKYNEARAIYTAAQYKIATDEMPEQRSIHLGIDLHMPPGKPVFAFLDGKIHSFNNNSEPLDYGPTIILEHQTDDSILFYSLYGHLNIEALDGLQPGMPIRRGDIIAHIGGMDVNGGWPPHLHFQIITDMLDETGNFAGVARPSERDIWTAISPDPNLVLCIAQHCSEALEKSSQEILLKRKDRFGKNLSITYDTPLKIVRGRGQYLYNEAGQVYLDGVNNVCHVGHCHGHVVAAGQRQMAVLNTNTRYLHDHIVTYAERLLKTFPDPLRVCFFVCTGSEANELALRLATTYTARQELITIDGAYHGNTQALIDISPYKHDGPGGRGSPPWVHTVRIPDGYRGPHKGFTADIGRRYATYVKEAIEQIQKNSQGVAAFVSESMLGCAGQIVLPDHYLQEAFKHVRNAGGVCIVDEVQVGFGRVGSHFWAFETQNVIPDIVTLGKPMGNGHPVAAVITTRKIADAFANGMEYFNTFGGNPVSCAIGMAVLDVIENEGLQENAKTVGQVLLSGLQALKRKYPLIGDVRGMGLYVGVELVKDRQTLEPATAHADHIINRMKDHGILISTDGPMENVLKMKPPLVWTRANAEQTVDTLDKILSEDRLQFD